MNTIFFTLNAPLFGKFLQGGPFPGIGAFQNNYFFSGGIGLWLFFLLLAVISVAVISYETQRRNISAPGLKVGVYIALVLLIPSILFRFTNNFRNSSNLFSLIAKSFCIQGHILY